MQAEHFYKLVQERAGLDNQEQAKVAIKAVFGALRDRISGGGAHNLASQLPHELRELWDAGFLHDLGHALGGVERMHLNRFLVRVQNTAGLSDVDEAEVITRAVFTTLREQITQGEQHAIYSQLPDDLKDLWAQCGPPEQIVGAKYDSRAIGPAHASLERSDEQLRQEVLNLLNENDQIDAEDIEVEAHQGKVTLRGHLDHHSEAETAAQVAKMALGVVDVENDIDYEEE